MKISRNSTRTQGKVMSYSSYRTLHEYMHRALLRGQELIFYITLFLTCRSHAYSVQSLDENGSRQGELSLSRLSRKIHENHETGITDCCIICINHACINTFPCEVYAYLTCRKMIKKKK